MKKTRSKFECKAFHALLSLVVGVSAHTPARRGGKKLRKTLSSARRLAGSWHTRLMIYRKWKWRCKCYTARPYLLPRSSGSMCFSPRARNLSVSAVVPNSGYSATQRPAKSQLYKTFAYFPIKYLPSDEEISRVYNCIYAYLTEHARARARESFVLKTLWCCANIPIFLTRAITVGVFNFIEMCPLYVAKSDVRSPRFDKQQQQQQRKENKHTSPVLSRTFNLT